ncbi:hypothetical protein [Desulfovibrio sp.]|uniref:hypothetical protein n=1 Tax=Desulfovibrio sp. TaxID=885 RepID=UPI003FD8E9B5
MKYNPPAGSQDPDAKYVTGQPGKVRGSAVPAEAVEHPQREIVEVIRQATTLASCGKPSSNCSRKRWPSPPRKRPVSSNQDPACLSKKTAHWM